MLRACCAKDKQHLHLPGGHVGAVISKHAAKTLWPQIVAFYEKHAPGWARWLKLWLQLRGRRLR